METAVSQSNGMPTKNQGGLGVIPSLDGWRAVAIVIVLLSHAGFGNIVPGGLGVTIFFFLSGYLITTLLRMEFTVYGSISLKNFFVRRFLRLTPPLFVTVVIANILTYVGITRGGVSLEGVLAQLFYLANYYSIFFDAGGTTPAGTGIFWSLAIEEHFYLVFPLLFYFFYSTKNSNRFVLWLVFTCTIILFWRIFLVLVCKVDASRTYYATDTRIDSLIYGCCLALAINPIKGKDENLRLTRKDILILFSSTALLLATLLFRNPVFRETLRYTIQGITLIPIFFYSIKFSKNFIFKFLNLKLVKLIGKYSYSIYLCHYILIENIMHISNLKLFNFASVILLSALYAIFIDKCVDKYFHNMKKHYMQFH